MASIRIRLPSERIAKIRLRLAVLAIVRRAHIRRASLDEAKALQLLAGPDVRLVAGGGYSDPSQAALEQMRADWRQHGAALLAWWRGDDSAFAFKPWHFVPRDPECLPWAAAEFGEPGD